VELVPGGSPVRRRSHPRRSSLPASLRKGNGGRAVVREGLHAATANEGHRERGASASLSERNLVSSGGRE
jgi:hypothetical protein